MRRRRKPAVPALLLAGLLLLSSCAPAGTPTVPQTVPETTAAQTTAAPGTTAAPTTAPPETTQPETAAPETTAPPTTAAPEATQPETTAPQPDFLVQFASAYGETPAAQAVFAGERLTEPEAAEVSGKTFEGWYLEGIGGKWNFDEDTVTESMILTAVYTDPVPRAASRLNMHDVGKTSAVMKGTNAAVVIYIGFTDGYVCDREKLENIFTAEYGQERAMESVSTYFRYNSYGNVTFDWYFYYYESGMSCKEAFDATETTEDLTDSAFAEFQRSFQGDLKDLDRNGDGYVDLLYFVTGEDSSKTKGDGGNYLIFGGATPTESIRPDPDRPVMHCYSKVPYEDWLSPLQPAIQRGGIRVLLHETGHQFGLVDYYNSRPYGDEDTFETLGEFDMQSLDFSDWNVYSRFACGWLSPYVIDGKQDEVTIRLGCSSEVPDAVLIPTAAGWNGTAFDEYILIDVLAPYAAAGFDWPMLSNFQTDPEDPRMQGGVRVYHVDGRLARVDQYDMASNRPATSYEELLETIKDKDFRHGTWLWDRHYNSDGIDPLLPGDSRFHHLIEIVPSDGSKRFRHNEHKLYWQAEDTLTVTDLYGPGDVFSMEKCADAFADAPLMNNGSTLDYEVRVDFYDPEAREAIITVRKIR